MGVCHCRAEDARQLRPRWNPGELWFDRFFFAVAA